MESRFRIKACIQVCVQTTCVCLVYTKWTKGNQRCGDQESVWCQLSRNSRQKEETVPFQVNEISPWMSQSLPFQHKCSQNNHNTDQFLLFGDWCPCKASDDSVPLLILATIYLISPSLGYVPCIRHSVPNRCWAFITACDLAKARR